MHYFGLWQSNWPHHCSYNHNLQLLYWLHRLSSHIIMTAIIGLLVSMADNPLTTIINSSNVMPSISMMLPTSAFVPRESCILLQKMGLKHANSHEVLMCLQ
jgi:hypothetical protein